MPDTALEYLAGSAVRPELLAVLRDYGRLSLRDLADRVSASRRTVKRTMSTMESRGWIRPTNGAYELTSLGAAMLSAHGEFRERSRIATRLRSFLEHVPAATFDFDVTALDDATVVTPDDDPTAFVDHLVDLRSDATRIREYAPFLMFDSLQQLSAGVGNGHTTGDVSLVVRTDEPPQSSPEYGERFDTLTDAAHVDVHVYPDGPMLGFGVADGCAFLGAADDRDMPAALLKSDAPELVSWVERQFERCLDAAEPRPAE